MKRKFWRPFKKWLRKKENILIEFLSILFWVIIGTIALLLFYYGLLDLLTLLQIVFGLILAFLPIYFYLIKKREQTMLISFTSKYLLEKEESKIDELLGILIAGKWEKLKIDPIEEFFKCLREMCLKSDFEMRRRIAEALPALFKINLEENKEIVGILRRDWDERWKSDNRRRTIEALPYIIDKEKEFVKDNLHIIEGDEIFAIIAMVEIIDVWREKVNKKEAEKLFAELKDEMERQQYGSDEINATIELWNLLDLIRSEPNQAIKMIEELKGSPNIYLQICIARNLKHFSKRFPQTMLSLMEHFIGKDKHKNVRRPIAKEDSVGCLIELLQNKRHFEKSKEVIWKLINDEDDIIRLATFDKVEKVLDIDSEFGNKILQHVIEKNRHPKLVERAKTLMKRNKG
ncbi:MAG: hypothetical protein DDT23_00941 [candidate division WS2 bacterium]|nr:hypothetical protein [Candidatus Lithacetigena glycinireducens]